MGLDQLKEKYGSGGLIPSSGGPGAAVAAASHGETSKSKGPDVATPPLGVLTALNKLVWEVQVNNKELTGLRVEVMMEREKVKEREDKEKDRKEQEDLQRKVWFKLNDPEGNLRREVIRDDKRRSYKANEKATLTSTQKEAKKEYGKRWRALNKVKKEPLGEDSGADPVEQQAPCPLAAAIANHGVGGVNVNNVSPEEVVHVDKPDGQPDPEAPCPRSARSSASDTSSSHWGKCADRGPPAKVKKVN
jgi:hypothetical protein